MTVRNKEVKDVPRHSPRVIATTLPNASEGAADADELIITHPVAKAREVRIDRPSMPPTISQPQLRRSSRRVAREADSSIHSEPQEGRTSQETPRPVQDLRTPSTTVRQTQPSRSPRQQPSPLVSTRPSKAVSARGPSRPVPSATAIPRLQRGLRQRPSSQPPEAFPSPETQTLQVTTEVHPESDDDATMALDEKETDPAMERLYECANIPPHPPNQVTKNPISATRTHV